LSAFHILIIGDIHYEGKKLLKKKADIKVTTNFEKNIFYRKLKMLMLSSSEAWRRQLNIL